MPCSPSSVCTLTKTKVLQFRLTKNVSTRLTRQARREGGERLRDVDDVVAARFDVGFAILSSFFGPAI
jgi:hypothetical protein